MKHHIGRTWRILRTTGIGGLLFLLPLIVIGVLLGYVWNVVVVVYDVLKGIIPESLQHPATLVLLFLVAIVIVLLLCFACGLLARRAIARRFSRTVEKQLLIVFPKYGIYKDLLAGNIGGDEHAPTLVPVSVRLHEHSRLAFEAERLADGRVIVYLPGAPDAWNGCVVLVDPEQVERLDVAWPEVVGVSERLGRDSAHLTLSKCKP